MPSKYSSSWAIATIFLVFATSHVPARATLKIGLQVQNRFRLLINDQEEARYYQELEQRLICGDVTKKKAPKFRKYCSDGRRFSRQIDNPNFSTRWQANLLRFPIDLVHNVHRDIKLNLIGLSKPQNFRCKWSVGSRDLADHSCTDASSRVTLGSDRSADLLVKVQITTVAGSAFSALQAPFHIRDVVIASVGDSFISGEGNPQRELRLPLGGDNGVPGKRAEWLDLRCHRSLFTSAAIAAERLARSTPTQSVTFLPIACSGAQIQEGILRRYLGRETVKQATAIDDGFDIVPNWTYSSQQFLSSQISALHRSLCPDGSSACGNSAVTPDLIIVSTGGNEVGFGKIVRNLAGGSSSVGADVTQLLRKLPARYDELADSLSALNPKNIITLSYLDPTETVRIVNGEKKYSFCSDFGKNNSFVPHFLTLFGFGVSAKGLKEAHEKVLVPLNAAVAAASQKHGWRHVSLPPLLVRGHGYCNRQRSWFYTYQESINVQGVVTLDTDPQGNSIGGAPTGAMHPNIFGHFNMAERIYSEFATIGLTTQPVAVVKNADEVKPN